MFPHRPELVTNPRGDERFRAAAEAALAAGAETADELQSALRSAAYPRVVVRARELSAESALVWYVYREGRWAPPEGLE